MLSHFNKSRYFSVQCDPAGLTQTGNLSSLPKICLLSRQPNAALRQLEEHSSFHDEETTTTLAFLTHLKWVPADRNMPFSKLSHMVDILKMWCHNSDCFVVKPKVLPQKKRLTLTFIANKLFSQ